jgi:hypothetical protein
MSLSISENGPDADAWPELSYGAWKDTCATLHLWSQIVGKLRLACSPWINHSWHATHYVTARGLTTATIPYGRRTFQVDFDLIDHVLLLTTSEGSRASVELRPRSVADFYRHVMAALERLGVRVEIHGSPNEVADPIPFAQDELHGEYDAVYANRFWRVVASSARVLGDFRSRFIGKCSPVHLFWGGLDLAVTRFSGRTAPPHPGGTPNLPAWVGREAYSHEVISAGFWPGNDAYPHAIFYSYAYPAQEGFADRPVQPRSARWDADLSEFVLPYDELRATGAVEADLMAFLQSTYDAAADLAGWERASLEWPPGAHPPPGGWPPGAPERERREPDSSTGL